MLSFEITAIDIILAISVIILLVLYWTKLSKITEHQPLRKTTAEQPRPEKTTTDPQDSYAECPRGFGHIKRISNDGSVSERCLDCYKSMDCYGKTEEGSLQLSQYRR